MQFIEIKKDIYLAIIVLGAILLFLGMRLGSVAFGEDLAATLLFLITVVQGSICLGFGAFTWIFHEDPEIWQ